MVDLSEFLARMSDGGIVRIGFAFCGGFDAFLATFVVASFFPGKDHNDLEVRMIRRLAKVVKLTIPLLIVLALPLLYVAAYKQNPAANQDATVLTGSLSWNFWYPRCATNVLLHGLLGPSVKIHHGVRWMYLAFLLCSVSLDAVSCLSLLSQTTCIQNRMCRVPDGYTANAIVLLTYRDYAAIGLQTWVLFNVCYIMASVGLFSDRFSWNELHRKHDRAHHLKTEMKRCGFLPGPERDGYEPLFGIRKKSSPLTQRSDSNGHFQL
ncbi:hypothetical protein M885DRAFT_522530 [Pelagophyceae sp. CCMP2097]|nr:hypothetical protein M885DRAFT_522530 [Pelagophyceae sp. CCMP2097]